MIPFRQTRPNARRRAMTLIEVSIVVAVMLSLVTVLLIGFAAYKRGSDRSICVQNISTVQKAMRSYSNLAGHFPGDPVTSLSTEIIGAGKFLEEIPVCPASGSYTFSDGAVPDVGTLFMNCSIPEHFPSHAATW
jgi:prepilin-type N-terminal cleavage/methylation domain-containing protein